MSPLDSRTIDVARIVDAPCDLVFAAFTEPSHLVRWWGPEGFGAADVVSDPRPGGVFTLVMVGPDGSKHPVEGAYLDVEPPGRLVVETSAIAEDGTRLLTAVTTVELTDLDGKTEIRVRSEGRALVPEANPMLAGMELGWIQSLRCVEDHVTGAADRQFVLMRMLDADPAKVFEVWTSPEHVASWFGPAGFSLTTHEMDVRPGGEWRFTMHGPDGEDYENLVRYEEVAPGERLVYLHLSVPQGDDPPFRGVVTFDAFMDGTIITMRGVFDTVEERDDVIERYDAIVGGEQTLDRLVAYVGARA